MCIDRPDFVSCGWAGRHLAKVSFDQATLGQDFQPRQMAKEIMTKALELWSKFDQGSNIVARKAF